MSHPLLDFKNEDASWGLWCLGTARVPSHPHLTEAGGLTPGNSFVLRQDFKGSPALQGVTEGKVERSAKATQASWMPSCVAWQADPSVKDSGRASVGSATQRRKTSGKLQKQVCFNRGQTSYPSLWHVSQGTALRMSRKVWPYRGQGCLEVFSAKATEEMRQELSVKREPKVT